MKRKEVNNKVKIKGFYVNELTRGFMGEQNEGKAMLKRMGLSSDTIPFSVIKFLQKRKTFWKDITGNVASIHFKTKGNQIECFGSYLGQKKSVRVFREWSIHEDLDKISKLESEAIGDLCMRCIYDPLFDVKTIS